MVVQKIKTNVKSEFDLAYKYFSILSVINDLKLVNRDLQLIAFSIEKDESIDVVKHEFVKKFKSSIPTVGNIISKLYAKKVFTKKKRLVTINPILLIDFKQDLGLAINFKHIDSNNGDKG